MLGGWCLECCCIAAISSSRCACALTAWCSSVWPCGDLGALSRPSSAGVTEVRFGSLSALILTPLPATLSALPSTPAAGAHAWLLYGYGISRIHLAQKIKSP